MDPAHVQLCVSYFEVHFPELELPVVFLFLQATDSVVQLTNLLLQFVCHGNKPQTTLYRKLER